MTGGDRERDANAAPRRAPDRIIERLCCPHCLHGSSATESSLHTQDQRWGCSRCKAVFPVHQGVPDLRPAATGQAAGGHDEQPAVEFYERVHSENIYGREVLAVHQAALEGWLRNVDSRGLVIELGPGKGALQTVHPGYVGTDISVAALTTFLRRPGFAADAQQLPLRAGSVDFLFSVATLEHIPDPERAFAEIARVLAPGRGTAYLAPAWYCRSWAAEGLHVRPYRDLDWGQRLRKTTIPLRDSLLWQGATIIPPRFWRRLWWSLHRRPARLRYRPLTPNYEIFWASDADATARLDPHETALYYESRGFEVLSPPSLAGRLFHRYQPLVVRKPGG